MTGVFIAAIFLGVPTLGATLVLWASPRIHTRYSNFAIAIFRALQRGSPTLEYRELSRREIFMTAWFFLFLATPVAVIWRTVIKVSESSASVVEIVRLPRLLRQHTAAQLCR